MIGAYRARAVPFNVNHHYHPDEVAALLDQIGAEAIVYHRRLGPLLADAARGRVLVDVDDGSGVATARRQRRSSKPRSPAPHRVDELPVPSPDDLYLVCTGGTTGRPKGVLWRQGDIYVAAMGGAEGATGRDDRRGRAGPAGMLVRGAAAHARGRAVDGVRRAAQRRHRRAARRCRAVRRRAPSSRRPRANGCTLLTIVGDAYARPLVDELRARPYDLSSLQQLVDGRRDDEPRR